jgi:squalene synthase HpnC
VGTGTGLPGGGGSAGGTAGLPPASGSLGHGRRAGAGRGEGRRPAAAPVPHGLARDFALCARVAARHRENFTVASRLAPAGLRPHMHALYAFCRGVDDLGDEFPGDRPAALDAWEAELRRCYGGRPERPEFRALQETIRRFDLPPEPFFRLIEANRRDQVQRRYRTFSELREYCACSAEPVGRLVLALWGYRDAVRQRLSDATCTGLQLANFWQDIGQDLEKRDRCYLPLEDLERFGLAVEDLRQGRAGGRLRALMAFEVERARRLLARGSGLEPLVPGRLAFQLRLYRLGGEAVLRALERQGLDPLARRPAVGWAERAAIALRALLARHPGCEAEVVGDVDRAGL